MFTSDNEFIETVKTRLNTVFSDAGFSFEMVGDMPQFNVEKTNIIPLFKLLYNELDFKFLTDLCGVQYPESEKPFGVVYHLHNMVKNQRIRIKSFTNSDNPVFPSVTGIFSAANWMERETYDFFGIQFDGHPNLTRILNVEDMDYFPLRKEYPLEDATREDKDDTMFGR